MTATSKRGTTTGFAWEASMIPHPSTAMGPASSTSSTVRSSAENALPRIYHHASSTYMLVCLYVRAHAPRASPLLSSVELLLQTSMSQCQLLASRLRVQPFRSYQAVLTIVDPVHWLGCMARCMGSRAQASTFLELGKVSPEVS